MLASSSHGLFFSNSEQRFCQDNLLDADDWGNETIAQVSDDSNSPLSSLSSNSNTFEDLLSVGFTHHYDDSWLVNKEKNDTCGVPKATEDFVCEKSQLAVQSKPLSNNVHRSKPSWQIKPEIKIAVTKPKVVKLDNGQFYVERTLPNTCSQEVNMNVCCIKNEESILVKDQLKNYKRQQRLIKNRESANLSRQRKKQHIKTLESHVTTVTKINQQLQQENEDLKKHIQALEDENCKLRQKCFPTVGTKRSTAFLAALLLFIFNPFNSSPPIITPSSIRHSRTLLQYDTNRHFNAPKNENNYPCQPDEMFLRATNVQKRAEQLGRDFKGGDNCGEQFNKTKLSRLNKALEGLVHNLKPDKETHMRKSKRFRSLKTAKRLRTKTSDSAKVFVKPPNCNETVLPSRKISSPPYFKFLRGQKKFENFMTKDNSSEGLGNIVEKSINRKDDTFYLAALKDYMVLPAKNYSLSQRPKVAIMLPAYFPYNSTSSGHRSVPMLQIDCLVVDTRIVEVARNYLLKNLAEQLNT